jgi:adenylosuccinate lyase
MTDNSPMSLLASRYATAAMREIFAPEAKIIAERKLWIAVMRAQSALGHAISKDVITDYENVITRVDLAAIDAREKQTRHDVKARIEEFNSLAGHEAIHAGMTSRDLTENIEALQIRNGLDIVHDKVVTLLARLAERATQYVDQPIAGRSHNVPAQITTLGKRFASAAEELLFAYERLTALQDRFPMRGIKGPVGTAQDSIDLLGSADAHFSLEGAIAKELGFDNVLDSTGQIYPRSFDYDVVTTLVQIASSPSSLATSIRLMAGAELVTEGFKAGQVGSSAMPHKMNTRSCERVNGLSVVLAAEGYPSAPKSGGVVTGFSAIDNVQIYHAGTAATEQGVVASGGRVLTITGIGEDLTEARNRAYRAISQISLPGSFYRTDIALNASVAEKGN